MYRSYLTPNGKRVYKVRQMLNDSLSYKIVTVPIGEAESMYNSNYSNQKRWPDFKYSDDAQYTLDAFAKEENLTPYQGKGSNA